VSFDCFLKVVAYTQVDPLCVESRLTLYIALMLWSCVVSRIVLLPVISLMYFVEYLGTFVCFCCIHTNFIPCLQCGLNEVENWYGSLPCTKRYFAFFKSVWTLPRVTLSVYRPAYNEGDVKCKALDSTSTLFLFLSPLNSVTCDT